MHQLAQGVGDLKRVLTNVKTRGGWGEIQLGTLLEQMLAPEQFARNVKVLPTADTAVEFAIRLPGRSDEPVWLPIDAKFPLEDYQRLSDAREAADPLSEELASRSLTARFTQCAKEISEKYIHPPHTTDFALMFLPTEGLYGEAARSPDLLDRLQQRHRVIVAGPVTFAALLNSLQIGFRTVAIEQRSSEVWALLGAVKTEFAKFGSVLEKVKKNLDQASNTLDGASTRTRAIERKLRKVEEVPWDRAERLIEQDDEPPLESSG
jgi:DNA recombination protein RmuC